MQSNGMASWDPEKFIDHILPGASPEGRVAPLAGGLPYEMWQRPEPQLRAIPGTTRGFLIRVDLLDTKPAVWRRIEVPGDLTLPRLHDVLQAALGWSDSHLHRFRMGQDRNAPEFLTQFDVDEGDEGLLEDDVRLDQIIATKGDRLWYDYDFGDGWEHVLRVEKLLDDPPKTPRCVSGKLACPPEDCGGIAGYQELAVWVRSDYDDAHRPEVFGSTEEGRDWLPEGWHPDVFDLAETNELIAMATAEPIPMADELASLVDLSRNRGSRRLRNVLADPVFVGPVEISAEDAARMTESFRVLLNVIGEGTTLTNAGYLRPVDVEQIAERTGLTEWWYGKANREDLTRPVAVLRATARSLGLILVRKRRIAPTRAAKRIGDDPDGLIRHIIGRLPLGNGLAERDAGWVALAVIGAETPAEQWDKSISDAMFDLGWRDSATYGAPAANSPTLDLLEILAGVPRTGWRPRGVDTAVAAAARAAIRP